MSFTAEVIIEVRFKTAEEGGRKTPVQGGIYACPLIVDGKAFDCRIAIDHDVLVLGEVYQLPVQFLNRELVLPLLAPEKPIKLWEGKDVASGTVLEIIDR